MNKLILIANPGSSSRKYSLYLDGALLSSLHFEYENEQIICSKTDFTPVNARTNSLYNSTSKNSSHLPDTWSDFAAATSNLSEIWSDIFTSHPLDLILIRLVATGDYFTRDRLASDESLAELQKVAPRMPLHIPPVLTAIDEFSAEFPSVPVALISDSAFHADRPVVSRYYAIDPSLADRHQIKRYGAHGLSVESVVYQLQQSNQLPARLIVCHLGSGCSVTAVKDGKSFDTSMGYTPLEGVMMSTRSGSIDPAAVLALQHILPDEPDYGAGQNNQSSTSEDSAIRALSLTERYLNQNSGLLGVSGSISDCRLIMQKATAGDPRARLAYDMFLSRLRGTIGQMFTQLNGADALALTATMSERDPVFRRDLLSGLNCLGFHLDPAQNSAITKPSTPINIAAKDSKPIFVVPSDEAGTMLRHAEKLS